MRNEIPHATAPVLSIISGKYPDAPSVSAFLLENAQTSPFPVCFAFEPSKFMRSSLTQTDVSRFFRFGFFDVAS